jgi:phosphatidyl-myo-inositol dimannoside synthase
VNSGYTENLALHIGIASDRIRIVHPGVELPDWSARDSERGAFRARLGLGERPLLLAAGRLTERKGLAPFIRNALPGIVRRIPQVMLIVIGEEASQALKHQAGVVQQIENAVRDTGMGAHVRLLGAVDDASLSAAYFAADLLVFPVLDRPGDVEGFGMVAIEAAAHGLPTVAFNVGGVGDAVSEGLSGWLIRAGDYATLADTVSAALHRLQNGTGTTIAPQRIRSHAERFSWEVFDARLLASLPIPNAEPSHGSAD